MTSPRPMTELYERYRSGDVSFEDLKRQVERATEDYRRSSPARNAASEPRQSQDE